VHAEDAGGFTDREDRGSCGEVLIGVLPGGVV